MNNATHEDLARSVVNGDRRSVARAISLVESGTGDDLHRRLMPHTGSGWRIGVTGPPGAGKSSLISTLAAAYAKRNKKVAILAVDPSSPFTSGAVLGDRIRMADLAELPGVYVRSMATRGAAGGLGHRTWDVMDVLEAGGFDVILLESVGVGQQDIDIQRVVDTTLLLFVPESGDHIQAMKAGIMEAAHLYVVNKLDRPQSSGIIAAVTAALVNQHREDPDWVPKALGVSATQNTGIQQLIEEMDRHHLHLSEKDRLGLRRREVLTQRLRDAAIQAIIENLQAVLKEDHLSQHLKLILSGEVSIGDVAAKLAAKGSL